MIYGRTDTNRARVMHTCWGDNAFPFLIMELVSEEYTKWGITLNDTLNSFAKIQGNTIYWYHTESADYQFNNSYQGNGAEYFWIAL